MPQAEFRSASSVSVLVYVCPSKSQKVRLSSTSMGATSPHLKPPPSFLLCFFSGFAEIRDR